MTLRQLLRPLVLTALALVAAVQVVRQGASQAVSVSAPALLIAERLAPSASSVLTQKATLLVAKSVAAENASKKPRTSMMPRNSSDLQKAGLFARRALSDDITQVDAMAIYGLAADARGDHALAKDIMLASASLSKRDVLTRLWLIEDSAKRNRLGEMLGHIDIALRTSAAAQDMMFPLLARALSDPSIIPGFVQVLRRDPPWGESFLYAAATSGQATRNLSQVYLALDKDYKHEGQDLSPLIMEQLIAQRLYGDAFKFSQGVTHRRTLGYAITDPNFARHEGLEPLTWSLTSNSAFDASRSVNSFDKTGLQVLSSGSGQDVVARQLLRLRPGRYRFRNAATSDFGQIKLDLEWQLRCAVDNSPIGGLAINRSKSADWLVPAACPYQWLELNADAAGTSSSETVFVHPVELTRLTD